MTFETRLIQRILIVASRLGHRLFRNNVGNFLTSDGRRIQTGLCPGSADTIGWTTVTITPLMINRKIAVFTACEAKSPTGKPQENQTDFLNAVRKAGGIAIVAYSENDYMEGIK